MGWQDIIVGAVAIVVIAIIARKTWRLFTCHETTGCDSCTKECRHRKQQ